MDKQLAKGVYKLTINGEVIDTYCTESDCLAASLELRILAAQPRYEGMTLEGKWDPAGHAMDFTFM